MKKALITAAVVAVCATTLAGAASAQDDILKHRIDDPQKDHWSTVGADQKTTVAKSQGVPGDLAYRVKVNAAGADPWSTAAVYSVAGAVKKGDVVLFAFWARAEKPPQGAETADVNVRVQQNAAPYTGVAEAYGLKVGPEWKMYYVSAKSPVDVGPGQGSAQVHLGKAKQTVDLGPALVLDLGPDYPMAKLPKNE